MQSISETITNATDAAGERRGNLERLELELAVASIAGELRRLDLELTTKLARMAELRRRLEWALGAAAAAGVELETSAGPAELARVRQHAARLIAPEPMTSAEQLAEALEGRR